MQRPVSAEVTRERWQPPPESSLTVTLTSALSGATPEKAHRMQQSGPGGAAFVTPTTPAPHTLHCHGLLSRICRPSTCHLVTFGHSVVGPHCLCLRPPSPEGGGDERGAAQASRRQMHWYLPRIERENGRLLHPRRPPMIFLSFSDAGLSGWKGILLAVLAVFHTKGRPITLSTVYI